MLHESIYTLLLMLLMLLQLLPPGNCARAVCSSQNALFAQLSDTAQRFSSDPIKKVRLYHPPVVAQSRSYNVTAWTQTVHGLRGHRTLVGDVGYIWDIEGAPNEDSVPVQWLPFFVLNVVVFFLHNVLLYRDTLNGAASAAFAPTVCLGVEKLRIILYHTIC